MPISLSSKELMFSEPKKHDFAPWVPILEAVAKPARYPRFHELTSDGQWKDWSPHPQLSDEEPTLVGQPQWTEVLRPVGYTRSYELELYPGGLHHEPLEHGSIRLLDMQNARFKDNVLQGFRLITVNLADAPLFDALSYCWGDMRLCTGILFNTGNGPNLVERMFRVTEDLATCLVSILMTRSLEDKPKYLWVDQICINQEDILERNHQVPLMTKIYQTARQVLVWLGQKSNFSLNNFEFPESPAADTDVSGQSLMRWVLDNSIFARPWFFRLWTFQEAVLAKRIQVLVGVKSRSWESLVDQAYTIDHPKDATIPMVEMNKLTRKLNWLIIGSIRQCRELVAQAGLVELQSWLPLIVPSQQCRNPRDKVYALIGLNHVNLERESDRPHPPEQRYDVPESTDPQESTFVEGSSPSSKRRPDVSFIISELPAKFVDYRKPVETVFRDFARLMVETRRSLKFLTIYEHDTTTWFPQFNSPALESSQGIIGSNPNRGQYAACMERIHVPEPPTDERYLDVKGKIIADVTIDIAEMPRNFREFYYRPGDVLDLQDLCRRCWTHVAPAYNKSAEDDWVAAFPTDMIDTIFCHEHGFHGTAPVKIDGRSTDEVYIMISALLGFRDECTLDDETWATVTDQDMQVLRVELSKRSLYFLGRRLVVLDTGHLALVQKEVQEGDKITILHGLDVPCVIRRTEDSDGWRWLGDAFIIGLMRGEGVHWKEDEADTFTLV